MSEIEATLKERESRYGEFAEHAKISQNFKIILRNNFAFDHLAPDQREALDMIVHKIARILNGDPNYADSWHDIAGYAILVEQRLVKKASEDAGK